MMVPVACGMELSIPCQLPPTSTSPPPVAPEAVRCAPVVTITLLPVATICPPLLPDEEASSVPEMVVIPSAASRIMRPALCSKLFASMTPLLLTADCIRASAALALIMTRPPSALMSPLFSARASTAPASTVRLIRPSPLKSSDTWFPAPRAVLPPGVAMVPSFVAFGAISATTPP